MYGLICENEKYSILLNVEVHGQLTETKLLRRAIYINIKKYQNRVSLKKRAIFLTG